MNGVRVKIAYCKFANCVCCSVEYASISQSGFNRFCPLPFRPWTVQKRKRRRQPVQSRWLFRPCLRDDGTAWHIVRAVAHCTLHIARSKHSRRVNRRTECRLYLYSLHTVTPNSVQYLLERAVWCMISVSNSFEWPRVCSYAVSTN